MRLKKELPYNIKKALTIFGLTGASFFMGGCDKNDEPVVPTMDVLVEISQADQFALIGFDENGNKCPSENVKKYAADPKVRTIYLEPVGTWTNYDAQRITGLRKSTLEMLLNYSDKIKGRGDFNFYPGVTPKQDSIWYVNNGWTINKYKIYYRSKSKDLTR